MEMVKHPFFISHDLESSTWNKHLTTHCFRVPGMEYPQFFRCIARPRRKMTRSHRFMLSQVLLEALWWKLHSRDQLNIAGWKMGHEWVDVFLYFLLKTGIFHPANVSLPEGTLILFTLATRAPWRLTNCCARRMIWYAIWGVIGCHEKKQVPICQEELLKPKASSWVMVMNNKFCTWCEYPDPTKLDNYIKWIGGSCWWFWDYSTPISWEKKINHQPKSHINHWETSI